MGFGKTLIQIIISKKLIIQLKISTVLHGYNENKTHACTLSSQ